MWQAEIRVDLSAIRDNVATLRAGTTAEVMAVVKADGYGHGMVASARAALAGGATWLGVCTIERRSGCATPASTCRSCPGCGRPARRWPARSPPTSTCPWPASISSTRWSRRCAGAGRPARVHLKIDSGLNRSGATAGRLAGARRSRREGAGRRRRRRGRRVEPLRAAPMIPGTRRIDRQLRRSATGWTRPRAPVSLRSYRHIANSAATLTRPDTHFDIVRPGIAIYGLSPIPERAAEFGLRPAMTVRARAILTKRVPAGEGVSYGHTYTTDPADQRWP